jgi:hypothetical protein
VLARPSIAGGSRHVCLQWSIAQEARWAGSTNTGGRGPGSNEAGLASASLLPLLEVAIAGYVHAVSTPLLGGKAGAIGGTH